MLAALLNALKLQDKDIKEVKIVISGAGAAGLGTAKILLAYGVPNSNLILLDSKGVLYKGREDLHDDKLGHFKSEVAFETDKRTPEEALQNSDVYIGLSAGHQMSKEMVKSMNEKPVIFALANPEPEILPEEVKSVRTDAVIATGRSDYPNQISDKIIFPFIFRAALDLRLKKITMKISIAAAEAIAELARETVPFEVKEALKNLELEYGLDYIIPSPFDPRLLPKISGNIAKMAWDLGFGVKAYKDVDTYKMILKERVLKKQRKMREKIQMDQIVYDEVTHKFRSNSSAMSTD